MRSLLAVFVATLGLACSQSPTPPAQDAAVDIAPADAGPSCAERCTAVTARCMGTDLDACTTACTDGRPGADGGVVRDVAACLDAAGEACGAARACLRPVPPVPFAAGPYGTAVRDVAADFTLPTQHGDWNFRSEWTGADNYVFLVYAPRNATSRTDYSAGLFGGALADLLDRSPRNVQYFFLLGTNAEAFADAQARWTEELDALPEADRAWWTPRVHFVSTPVSMLGNWIGEMLTTRSRTALPYKRYDAVQFAIDRTQRIREVGMLGRLAQNGVLPDITLLAGEPTYFNWEHARDQRLARESGTVVVDLLRSQVVEENADIDVTLPDAATMATFDTMEVDLRMDCPNHRDGECGAWDYLSHLWVCDEAPVPGDAGTGDAGTAGLRCDREIARWITTYWREARWVTDISGMLPQLQAGGRQRLRWYASRQFDPRRTDYITSLSLRFSNRGRGMRPVETVPLWRGGAWNAEYDNGRAPIRVTVPPGTRRTELYTLITGHGGVQPTNCAEFCNHEHFFSVGGMDFVQRFPEARAANACADRVGEGVVPNQHGTWYFGRGGWCPGLDVAPAVVDVTAQLPPGTETELRYRTRYNNAPVSTNLGNISLSSYLVYWR